MNPMSGNCEPGHYESEDCPCRPTVERFDGGAVLIIHNSFDGIEAVEEANQILGIKPKSN